MSKPKQSKQRSNPASLEVSPRSPGSDAPSASALRSKPDISLVRSVPAWLAFVSAALLVAEIGLPEREALPDQRIALANYLVARQVQIAQMSERLREDDFLPYIALTGQRTLDSAWLQAIDGYTTNLQTFLLVVDSPLDGPVAYALLTRLEDLQQADPSDGCAATIKLAATEVHRASEGVSAMREFSSRLARIRKQVDSDSLQSGDPVELTKLVSSTYGDKDLSPLFGGTNGQANPRSALAAILERRGAMIESIGGTIDACRDSYDQAAVRYNWWSKAFQLCLIVLTLLLSLVLVRRDLVQGKS